MWRIEKVKIFGKVYSMKDLIKIIKGKEDDVLEFVEEITDYICDCSEVRFHIVYQWVFKNKKEGQQFGKKVRVYVVKYPDDNSLEFNGDKKKEFIYYENN